MDSAVDIGYKTRPYILLLLTFLIGLNLKAQDQPNFILIYVDDLNFAGDAIGGHAVHTPNLQRIVDNGVNFSNAHANGTICSPSRASMLTGVYLHTSGYYGYSMGPNRWDLNPVLSSITNMFKHFKDNDYEVFGAGKLFHGSPLSYNESFSVFDSEDSNGNGPWAWDGVSTQNGQPVLLTHPSMPANFAHHTDGIAPLSDVPTIGNYTGWINRDGTPFNYVSEDDRDLLHDELARDFGVNAINSHDSDDPFFLAIGISRPHTPFYLPKKYFDLHPLDEIILPNIMDDDLDDVPIAMMNNRWNSGSNWDGYRALMAAGVDSSDQQWWLKRHLQGYYAGVSYVDDLLGDILDALDASPYADNTYVIYTSDHGYHLGEKTFIKKTTLYNEVTRIPFVISGPGIQAAAQTQTPVSCIDLYPTMVDLANLPNPGHTLDGYTLRPLLEEPESGVWEGPSVALSSAASDERIPLFTIAKALHQHHSVKSINMRYSLYATGEEELYDHAVDPNEYFNLARDPSYQTELEWHRSELLSMVGITDQFTIYDTTNYAFHGSFEQDLNGWKYAPNNSSVTPIVLTNGESTHGESYLQISSTQGVSLLNNNVRLETGQSYLAYFDARCLQSTNVELQIQRGGAPNFAILHTDNFQVSNTWVTYQSSFDYTDSINIFNNRLRFNLPAQATCDFDNVRLLKLPPPCQDNTVTFQVFSPEGSPAVEWTLKPLEEETYIATYGGDSDDSEASQFQELCLEGECYEVSMQLVFPAAETTALPGLLVLHHNGDTLIYTQESGTYYFCLNPSAACTPLNFNDFSFFSINEPLDQGTASILSEGEAVALANNAFKYIFTGYEVGPNTVLEFYFRSFIADAFYGVGFSDNGTFSYNQVFKIGGAITPPDVITGYEVPFPRGWHKVIIPVGEYYQGSDFERLLFMAGKPGDVPTGLARFANLRIYEQGECAPLPIEAPVQGDQSKSGTTEARYNVHIHPNPLIGGMLHYDFMQSHPEETRGTLRIYNHQGRLVHSTAIDISSSRGTVDIHHLAAGVYFLEFSAGRWLATHKLVRY